MTWNKEPFVFEEEEQPPSDRITVPLDLENVIMEGTRRSLAEKRFVEMLPNLDFALRFPESPSEKFKGIQLSVEEWRVVSFINPKNSIRQIAKACNMTDMDIRKVVVGLLDAGLVQLVKVAPTPDPSKKVPKRPAQVGTQPNSTVVNKLIERIKNL
jgi:hypothetical protein